VGFEPKTSASLFQITPVSKRIAFIAAKLLFKSHSLHDISFCMLYSSVPSSEVLKKVSQGSKNKTQVLQLSCGLNFSERNRK
jgi:hypothetical protein